MDINIETLEQFRKSARVIDKDELNVESFHTDCYALIVYCGYMYIEILDNRQFYLVIGNKEYTSMNLKQLERILWFDFAIDELLTDKEAIRPQLIKATKFNKKRDFNGWLKSEKVTKFGPNRYGARGADAIMTKKELKQYFYETFNR